MSGQTCWSCEQSYEGREIFCPHCGIILPPLPFDAFYYMGLPLKFDISPSGIKPAYLQRIILLHPDRFIQRSKREKLYATAHTENLNKAYKILGDPVLRAEAILNSFGVFLFDETQGSIEDPEVLEEIMAYRERLITGEDVQRLTEDIQKQQEDLLAQITNAFLQEQLDEARWLTIRYHYLQKLLKDMN